jgi:hypothetical protein
MREIRFDQEEMPKEVVSIPFTTDQLIQLIGMEKMTSAQQQQKQKKGGIMGLILGLFEIGIGMMLFLVGVLIFFIMIAGCSMMLM